MYKDTHQYVVDRDRVFYYVRRVSHDLRQHYASSRISFSLRAMSHQSALRAAKSVGEGYELLSLANWIKIMQRKGRVLHLN